METCSVVHDYACDSPANLSPPVGVRSECFRCGLPVCKPCSKVVSYYEHRRRICFTCLEEIERFADSGIPYPVVWCRDCGGYQRLYKAARTADPGLRRKGWEFHQHTNRNGSGACSGSWRRRTRDDRGDR